MPVGPPTRGIYERVGMHFLDEVYARPQTDCLLLITDRTFVEISIRPPRNASEPALPNTGGPMSRLHEAFAGWPVPCMIVNGIPHRGRRQWVSGDAHSFNDVDIFVTTLFSIHRDSSFVISDGVRVDTDNPVGTPGLPVTLRTYEEVITPLPDTSTRADRAFDAVTLELNQFQDGRQLARGLIVRVGKWVQGLMKVVRLENGREVAEVSCERWERVHGVWTRRVKLGRLYMPCAAAWRDPIGVHFEVITYGDWQWFVTERTAVPTQTVPD